MARKTEEGEEGLFWDGFIEGMPVFAKELIAGGFAKTVIAPLERLKILFQVWVSDYFRGNGASVARIVPYATLHYMAYEQYRHWIAYSFPGIGSGLVLDLVAGSFSGHKKKHSQGRQRRSFAMLLNHSVIKLEKIKKEKS